MCVCEGVPSLQPDPFKLKTGGLIDLKDVVRSDLAA